MKSVYVIIVLIIIASTSIGVTASAEENWIPQWIKNTASFWVNDEVSDVEFVNALQYLVKEEILEISPSTDESVIHSQYAEQEGREIISLSQDDVKELREGSGTPFGGMALLAELNGYPGPRHVLDAAEAGEIKLTNKQLEQIQMIYEEMRSESIILGEQIIDIEKEMDEAFKNGSMTEKVLQENVSQNAELYGKLRLVHLNSHLSMIEILTSEQVEKYNELRGYDSDDSCQNVPEGHDPEMWKLHHGCN